MKAHDGWSALDRVMVENKRNDTVRRSLREAPRCVRVFLVLGAAICSAAELKPQTVAAWDHYMEIVDARTKTAPAALRIDEQPDQAQRVQRGEIIVSQIKIRQAVPHGLIHDWVGDIFIPGATLPDVLAVERDYDRYPQWFGPTVIQASLLDRTNGRDHFTIRYVASALFVTVVLETEDEAQYFQVDPTRGYAVAHGIRIQEIHEFGKPEERAMPPDDGGGYLWRLYSISRFEQVDNGVYMEQETIGLSRGIPAAFRWLVEPAVKRLSKDLLEKSLRQTRNAVLSNSGK